MHFLPLKNKYKVPDERKESYVFKNAITQNKFYFLKSTDSDSPEVVF